MYVTGQGSLRYHSATESRTQVAPVLKAKDYALTAGDLDDRCQSFGAGSMLYIRVTVVMLAYHR